MTRRIVIQVRILYPLTSARGGAGLSGYNHPQMQILTLTGTQTRPYFDRMVDIYQAAFSAPPFTETLTDVLSFAARLPLHALNVDFRCVVARPALGEEIVGFAYGYSGMPRTWWYELVSAWMPDDNVEYWLGDYFEFAELALHPDWQGQGTGGLLHDALLEGLPYHTAALSTPQAETNAFHLYQKRGWQTVIENFEFPGVPTRYRIMGKGLQSH